MEQLVKDLFLESIETLIKNNTAKADITIKASITEISSNGEYYFIYQDKKHKCYNNLNLPLGIGEEVYITIPQGNLNLQKYIIGKEDTGNSETVKTLELEKQIVVSKEFNYNDFNTLKLDCGEGSSQVAGPIEYPFSEPTAASYLTQKYDTLLFSADFTTNFFSSVKGNYGLTLEIKDEKGKTELFTLDSSAMFGSIYNFSTPTTQSMLCDISSLGFLDSISVYLYQQDLTSEDYNGKWKDMDSKYEKYEIQVNRINFKFGSLKNSETYNTIVLSSPEGEKYNYSIDSSYEESNRKSLVAMINKEYINNALLRLEKYNYETKEWDKINDKHLENEFYTSVTLLSLSTENVDVEKEKTTYRVKLIQQITQANKIYENILITSNEYSFINQANLVDTTTIESLQNYRIVGSFVNGIHYSYKDNGAYSYPEESDRTFSLSIEKKEGETWKDITASVTDLKFSISPEPTMLESINDRTYIIKDKYSQSNYNNLIFATFVDQGVTQNIKKELYFGYSGIGDADYYLILIPTSKQLPTKAKDGSLLSQSVISYKIQDTATGEDVTNNMIIESYEWQAMLNDVDLLDDSGGNAKAFDCINTLLIKDTAAAVKLKLTCKLNNTRYNLEAVESIGYSDYNGSQDLDFSGCDRIEYQPDGTANYYKQPYRITLTDGGAVKELELSDDEKYYKPKNDIYNNEEKYHEVHELTFESFKTKYTIKIPVVYDRNLYSSSLVDTWKSEPVKEVVVDSTVPVSTKTKLSIGSKNNKNEFSGIVLGQGSTMSGFYGYQNGKESYAFKEDGTAFIGKEGTGRIWFDGNKGIIASNSWFDTKGGVLSELTGTNSGMKIDLDEPSLEAISQGGMGKVKISPGNTTFFEVSTQAANPWGGNGIIPCYLKFTSNGLTEISAAKISGIWLDGKDNFLRGSLDIATTKDDLTTRHASLSSIIEGGVAKGVFKGYGTSGEVTRVGACVVSGDGAALKYLGSNNYVSVSSDSVNLNGKIYINGTALDVYIRNIID